MSTISILNDKVTTIQVQCLNSLGAGVSIPTGDTFTAVSSAPASLGAAITGTPASPILTLTPLVQAGTGYTVTVTDTKGLAPVSVTVSITPDFSIATQLGLILSLPTTVPQPIPTAPGP